MNCVTLIGRLTKDPELRQAGQTPVASFTLAVDRPMSKEKTADFIRIACFGKTAENCEKFLSKGRLVGIQGRIQTGSYKTQSGETRYTTDVYAERVEFLDKGDKADKPSGPSVPEGFQALDEDDEMDTVPF